MDSFCQFWPTHTLHDQWGKVIQLSEEHIVHNPMVDDEIN